MTKDINLKPFDETTKLKLEIFGECFREWLPVFIHNPFIDRLYVYDFFAGSGTDIEGYHGSPLILLEEAKGANCNVCNSLNKKKVIFGFNELLHGKNEKLKIAIKIHLENCLKDNCQKQECQYKYKVGNFDFKDAFKSDKFQDILKNNSYAKFILLDQYGFKQVDDAIFKELVNSPKTDFIFFISSSTIDRFKTHPNTIKHIDTSIIDFNNRPKDRHKAIAKYFMHLINNPDYYLHHFTIKKGSNHYGLIFGSSHTLGMEKFLKVCWKKDKFSGESTDNTHDDFLENTLFHDPTTSNKKEAVKKVIKDKILNGEISDNQTGLKFALTQLCMPELFTQTVIELERSGKIKRTGDVNNTSTSIHRAKKYLIELIK